MFAVGDKVAVVSSRGYAPVQRKVARVMKRFVELDNGTKWSLSGEPYPYVSYSPPRIEAWNQKHERECMLARARTVARNLHTRLNEPQPNVAEAMPLLDDLQALMRRLSKEQP